MLFPTNPVKYLKAWFHIALWINLLKIENTFLEEEEKIISFLDHSHHINNRIVYNAKQIFYTGIYGHRVHVCYRNYETGFFSVWCSNSRFHGQGPQESVRRLPLGLSSAAPLSIGVKCCDCCPHLCMTIRLTMGNGLPQPLISHSARGHPLTHTHTRSYGPLTPSRLSRTRRSGDAMQRQVCSPD